MNEENPTIDHSLTDSIAMLEQILEVMPQAVDVLRTLYGVYCQSGQDDRAFEYLGRIIEVALGDGDAATAAFAAEELEQFVEHHAEAVVAYRERLSDLAAAGAAESAQAEPEPDEAAVESDLAEEFALAWRLYEENQLSQEEYSSILHDLTEISTKELDVPISVLHVLNDRGFTQMNRIMNYLSSRSGVPCISLGNFELNEEVGTVLPLRFAARDGALPFASFGGDLLVAVLNPFNNMLVDQVEQECGRRCRTYLVAPDDYDRALGRLRSLANQAA